MTITQYLRLLRQQWLLVTALAVLGAIGAGAYSFLVTPTYEAEVQLFVSTSGHTTDAAELVQGGNFTQQRVKSYADLLTSPGVLSPVIEQLKLETTPDDLAKKITAVSPLDTILINVTVADPSPQRASDIANAIGLAFPSLVNELETQPGQTVSPVKVSITRKATPPEYPVSPRKALDLALGLLVGLGLGVGAAVLRDSLDRTLGGRHQPGDIAGAPVLGTVADDPKVSDKPLIVHDTFSPRAEAFRHLRTNIRFLGVDHQIKSMVVTGSVQAEGKSTTAANIAIALAQSGENVVLIDADLRRPSVADLFGLTAGVGLTSVLLGDASLELAVQQWRDDIPLRVLTAGPIPPNPSELIGSTRMAELVKQLTTTGYTVIIDSPPLLPVTDAAVLSRVTDGALLVVRVGSTKVEQLTAAVQALRTAGAPILGLVLNRVPRKSAGYYGGYQHSYTSYAPAAQPEMAPASLPAPVAMQVGVHVPLPAPATSPDPSATEPQGLAVSQAPWPTAPEPNGKSRWGRGR